MRVALECLVILLPTTHPVLECLMDDQAEVCQHVPGPQILHAHSHIWRKQYTHEDRDGTSLSLGLRLVVWPCKSSSWSCRAILSAHLDKLPTVYPMHQPVRDAVSCLWQNVSATVGLRWSHSLEALPPKTTGPQWRGWVGRSCHEWWPKCHQRSKRWSWRHQWHWRYCFRVRQTAQWIRNYRREGRCLKLCPTSAQGPLSQKIKHPGTPKGNAQNYKVPIYNII